MEVFGLEAEESRVLCRDPVDLIKGAKEASTFEVTLICTIRVCELDEKRRRERKTTTTLLAIFPSLHFTVPALTHHHCHRRNSTLHHPRLPPVNSAHCETRLLPRCWRVLFPGIAAFADRAPPGSARRQQHVALLYLDSTFDLHLPPPTLGPLLRPSLPPRELPCRRLLRTVTPLPRAPRLRASSSSSPVVLEKHSTARVSRPTALSTLRTGQSPPTKQPLVQRARRPRHVSAPPSLIPALILRPAIACLFALRHLWYTLVTH